MKRMFLALLTLMLVLSPALGARRSGGSFGGRTMSRPSVTRARHREDLFGRGNVVRQFHDDSHTSGSQAGSPSDVSAGTSVDALRSAAHASASSEAKTS